MSNLDATLVNSIVGAGTMFRGTITVSGLLRIDGDFGGAVKTSGRVIIGREGRADCTIDAGTVVVGGVFRGTIYARDKVIALESAMILGSIHSPRLIAEAGVILDGAFHVRSQSGEEQPAKVASAATDVVDPVLSGTRPRARRRRQGAGAATRGADVRQVP